MGSLWKRRTYAPRPNPTRTVNRSKKNEERTRKNGAIMYDFVGGLLDFVFYSSLVLFLVFISISGIGLSYGDSQVPIPSVTPAVAYWSLYRNYFM